MEDFRTRIDLGILWLYQEYINTETQSPGASCDRNSRYALCLRNLIEGMKKHLEPRDKYVSFQSFKCFYRKYMLNVEQKYMKLISYTF